jgi:hypothetical protein
MSSKFLYALLFGAPLTLLALYCDDLSSYVNVPEWFVVVVALLVLLAFAWFWAGTDRWNLGRKEISAAKEVLQQAKHIEERSKGAGPERRLRLIAAHIPLGLSKYFGLNGFTVELAGSADTLRELKLNEHEENIKEKIQDACQQVAEVLKEAFDMAYRSCYEVDPNEDIFRVAVLLPEEVLHPDEDHPDDEGKTALYIQGATDIYSESFKERRYFCDGQPSYAWSAWTERRTQIGLAGKTADGFSDPRWGPKHDSHVSALQFCEIACIPVIDEMNSDVIVAVISIDTRKEGSLILAAKSQRLMDDAVRWAGIAVTAAVRKFITG